MKIRIDEGGQFSFKSASPLALCVVAAVIYPDSKVAAVEKFVAEKRREWDMPRELKAGEMDDGQLLEVAEFFVDADLRLVGIISDSEIFGFEAQRAHRAAQVAEFERASAVSKTAAGDPYKTAAIERLRTRFHNPRHISMPDFFQYAVLMPWLLARALSAGPVGYGTLLPPLESWSFDIAVDPRKGADPGKAGEALRDIVAPILPPTPAPNSSFQGNGQSITLSTGRTGSWKRNESLLIGYLPVAFAPPTPTKTPVYSSPTMPLMFSTPSLTAARRARLRRGAFLRRWRCIRRRACR